MGRASRPGHHQGTFHQQEDQHAEKKDAPDFTLKVGSVSTRGFFEELKGDSLEEGPDFFRLRQLGHEFLVWNIYGRQLVPQAVDPGMPFDGMVGSFLDGLPSSFQLKLPDVSTCPEVGFFQSTRTLGACALKKREENVLFERENNKTQASFESVDSVNLR